MDLFFSCQQQQQQQQNPDPYLECERIPINKEYRVDISLRKHIFKLYSLDFNFLITPKR